MAGVAFLWLGELSARMVADENYLVDPYSGALCHVDVCPPHVARELMIERSGVRDGVEPPTPVKCETFTCKALEREEAKASSYPNRLQSAWEMGKLDDSTFSYLHNQYRAQEAELDGKDPYRRNYVPGPP